MAPFDDTPHVPASERADRGAAAPAASDTPGGQSARCEREEGFARAHGAEQNRLFAALSLDEYARLLPHLTPVRLHVRDVLVEANEPMRDVWFVREGVCAVLSSVVGGGGARDRHHRLRGARRAASAQRRRPHVPPRDGAHRR